MAPLWGKKEGVKKVAVPVCAATRKSRLTAASRICGKCMIDNVLLSPNMQHMYKQVSVYRFG